MFATPMYIRCCLAALFALASPFALQLAASAQSTPPADVPALLQKLIASDEVQRSQIMEQFDQIQDPDVLVPPVFAALETVDSRKAWKLLDILARFPSFAKPQPLIRLARRSDQIPSTLATQLASIGAPATAALLNAIAEAGVTWKPEAPLTRYGAQPESNEPDQEAMRTRYFIHWAAGVLGDIRAGGVVGRALEALRISDFQLTLSP